MKTGKCPECGNKTVKEYRPFCCKRCADLDLGKWFNESYQLPGDSEIPDNIEEQ
jgi:endogenous inhibitor of DNA gyrase (YacG/DUF329 family)